MTRSLRIHRCSWMLAASVAVLVALTGCASIPVHGAVHQGNYEPTRDGNVGLIPPAPATDATPESIVRGFLQAAVAGPTSPEQFSVAHEYLTAEAAETWAHNREVFILSADPITSLLDPMAAADEHVTSVTVRATGVLVAHLDSAGTFTDKRAGVPHEAIFELVRYEDQWRVASLPDGLIVPSAVFGTAFHVTTLYFPSPDHSFWVPDVRWFPQQTWRTNAVMSLLEGPSAHLQGAAVAVLPADSEVAVNAVTEGADGTLEVSLTDHINAVAVITRGRFEAQVRASLADGRGAVDVMLFDESGPIVSSNVLLPSRPTVTAPAAVWREDGVYALRSMALEPFEHEIVTTWVDYESGYTIEVVPIAIAVNPDGNQVVILDGESQLRRITDEQPTLLIEGTRLVAPSIDRFNATWTADADGPIMVVTGGNELYELSVPWLAGRSVTSIRVSPGGERVAVVSVGLDGAVVHVAAVLRDARAVPIALAQPITVGNSVRSVRQAVWQDETVLALLGTDPALGGQSVVYLAGVGGLSGAVGGLPRRIDATAGSAPVQISAAVGTGEVLALNAEGGLYLRHQTALWSQVGTEVLFAQFPG